MSRIAWDAHDRLDALLELLAEREGRQSYTELKNARGRQNIRGKRAEFQRERAVNEIIEEYNAAKVAYDDHVATYQNATTDAERQQALADATMEQMTMLTAVTDYLMLNERGSSGPGEGAGQGQGGG